MNTAAKVLLVLLRIAIGWHFLYEGVFKIDSERGGDPYLTSRYYVQAATGRLRDAVNGASGTDVRARIEQWENDVARHFKARDNPLSDEQKFRLAGLGDELARMIRNVEADPDFPTDWYYIHEEVLKLTSDAGAAPAHFSSEQYLKASAGPFRSVFRGLAGDVDGFERLKATTAQKRIDARCEEILRHYEFNPAQEQALRAQRDELKRSVAVTLSDAAFRARLDDYRILSDRIRREAAQLTAPFSAERLDAARKKADVVAAELLAFVNEPLAELTVQAQAIATLDQMRAGPPPRPHEQTQGIDRVVEWGLSAIGLCLMLGLFTPVAATAAALQLAVFYLASPPWPGLPAMTVGGHYLYVDRNFIEMLAALVLAFSGTGMWAGLDRLVLGRIGRQQAAAVAAERSGQ